MKSNYKKLAPFIRQVDERNKDLNITRLLGVSIEKRFIESIANIIGTDMSSYKIVRKGQFAYGPVTSRNGDKVSIALLEEEKCIISSSYIVFEIVDTESLLPEYLNLWFKRPEFDRYARFHSHGSAREIFDWEEMCNVELPIPVIAEQQKIVDAYNAIERRIAIKRQINDNLEAQLNTLFKENLASYLTNDELPTELERHSLLEIAKYLNGLALQEYPPENKFFLPVLKIRELRQGYYDANSDYCSANIPPEMIIENKTIIFSWSGSLLVDIWCGGKVGLNQHLFKVTSQKYPDWLIYLWTKYHLKEFIRIADGKKTSMGHIKREDLANSLTVVPNLINLSSFSTIFQPIYEMLVVNKQELQELLQVKSVLLTQLSR